MTDSPFNPSGAFRTQTSQAMPGPATHQNEMVSPRVIEKLLSPHVRTNRHTADRGEEHQQLPHFFSVRDGEFQKAPGQCARFLPLASDSHSARKFDVYVMNRHMSRCGQLGGISSGESHA